MYIVHYKIYIQVKEDWLYVLIRNPGKSFVLNPLVDS